MARILSDPVNITITAPSSAWTAPYSLPSSGQVINLSVSGGNTIMDVATAANGWGNYGAYAIAAAIYHGYGFGAFSDDYSTAGGHVIAGCGGHGAGGIWGGFIFDFTTGMWVSRANGNGYAENPADPAAASIDWATGELADKTGIAGQLPIPGHGYSWHFCPPKSISGGTKGYMIKPCIAAGSDSGWDAKRAFKFDLDTGLWTYASDNNMDFDGAYLNPYTDGSGTWDTVTNRFYTPQAGANTGEMRYLERNASTPGWTWKKTSCPGIYNGRLIATFVGGRYFYMVYGGTPIVFQRVNLDNIGAGATTLSVTGSDLVQWWQSRWHLYPVDGCFYTILGKADRAAVSLPTAPSTLSADQYLTKFDPATMTVTRRAISGGIVALWEDQYSATPGCGNAFVYVPKLQCFAWFPRHDAPIQLIKP